MIALPIVMNEFLVKVQNSSMERRNRGLKSFSGHALLCHGHALLDIYLNKQISFSF